MYFWKQWVIYMSSSYFMQILLDRDLKLQYQSENLFFMLFSIQYLSKTLMMNTHLHITVRTTVLPVITFCVISTLICLPRCTEMGTFLERKKQIWYRLNDFIIRMNSKVKFQKSVRFKNWSNSVLTVIVTNPCQQHFCWLCIVKFLVI
jgi:hypothetical protein